VSGGSILLVRHGDTEWNLARRYQGWSDSPLTEQGVAQAEAIGRLLSSLPEARSAELVASPIGRARRTAEIIRHCLGRGEPLRFDDRLREISLGSWDGLDRDQIAALAPGIFNGDSAPLTARAMTGSAGASPTGSPRRKDSG
jgi:broad specificity phosphatase PhoE